jgi:simple sugar transport system substrate-binding protein
MSWSPKSLVAGAILLAANAAALAQEPLKIGFIYQSPVSDVGWVAVHEEAREALEKEFGSRIQTHVLSSVKVGPDAARNIEDLADQGYKMLVLGSFGYMNDGVKAAREHPEINFCHASGYKQAKNFSTYNARWYEGAYVAGVVAGKVTKTNQLGFVGAVPIPDVVSTLNAFTLGARSVNPKVTVKVAWVNDWYNPGKERDAATVLINEQSDVIMSGFQDSPSIAQAAEEKHVFVVGMFSDVSKYAPNYLLTSVTHDWLPYLRKVTEDSLAGKPNGSAYWGGLKDGAVALAKWNPKVPPDVVTLAQQTQNDIAAGRKVIFAGPLRDSQGVQRVAAGASLADKDIGSMNWLVEGINGSLPK